MPELATEDLRCPTKACRRLLCRKSPGQILMPDKTIEIKCGHCNTVVSLQGATVETKKR